MMKPDFERRTRLMRRTLHRADFGSSCQEIEDEDAYVLNFYAGFNQESLEEDAEVMAS